MKKRYYLIYLFFLIPCMAFSQKGLNINEVFDDHGKKEGSILIELGNDVLGNHTCINFYKSLIMDEKSYVVAQIEEAIKADIEHGSVISDSRKDGKLRTGYYSLGKNEKTEEYEYILFTNKSRKITLVYIRGNFPPKDLSQELDKLKDLFIKVNDKQIKLQ